MYDDIRAEAKRDAQQWRNPGVTLREAGGWRGALGTGGSSAQRPPLLPSSCREWVQATPTAATSS